LGVSSDMKEIRVGLIGLGGIINMHVEQMHKIGNMRVAAVCDMDESKVIEWGNRYGLAEAKMYTAFEDLVADSEVDAIISATPNNAHFAIVKACLLQGKPLMTEKPFTRTYQEARELRDLADRHNSDCFVGFSYRYVPSFRMARDWVASGKIGKVRHVSIQYLQDWGVPLYGTPMNWRWDPLITGTGVLHDLGTHMIDAARFIVAEPIEVKGMMRNLIAERPAAGDKKVAVGIDDFAAFTALLEGGIPAVFQTSRNAYGSGNQIEVSIYGDLGTLHMGYEFGETLTWIHQDEMTKTKTKEDVWVPESYKLVQMQDFANYVRGDRAESMPTLIDGYRNQLTLEAIIQSDKSGRLVQLNELENKTADMEVTME
jgi:predicted dehydrogenase